ncbi:hypothetical protein SAMD00023353_0101660 [Rosellinia necatrix]|uniref:Uncharacterized protein n=1 Tax=Rosellinia necatrix TaxID=77044 RepID=A0A1S8A572_ROSNE|nr:hypothetical protein SAMD00023353_0101660 [Rosellinia necatrix]
MYTEWPEKYDDNDYVKRPDHKKFGKTFVRKRLWSDCMPPPPGFGCQPHEDPVKSTYREELGIPR